METQFSASHFFQYTQSSAVPEKVIHYVYKWSPVKSRNGDDAEILRSLFDLLWFINRRFLSSIRPRGLLEILSTYHWIFLLGEVEGRRKSGMMQGRQQWEKITRIERDSTDSHLTWSCKIHPSYFDVVVVWSNSTIWLALQENETDNYA